MAMNLADMAHDDAALEVGLDVSCKLSIIMSLLRKLFKEGHHVLIFSQTHKMLNLIQVRICFFVCASPCLSTFAHDTCDF